MNNNPNQQICSSSTSTTIAFPIIILQNVRQKLYQKPSIVVLSVRVFLLKQPNMKVSVSPLLKLHISLTLNKIPVILGLIVLHIIFQQSQKF
ncbi:unnamed protein product [Paramecium octaurelia]|uniref:Transmembrane protein n=1 Tax=Paramecium octaurelia TaxID=43137 RepID=A0A8S1YS30_PAROT|nr:unnamed protein product [Paramecium octaurelia]